MIESVYRRKHYTGIIEILINTKDKWINYQLSKCCGLKLTHFYKSSGLYHDYDIPMPDGFNPLDYMMYHFQEKDQITVILIPKSVLLKREDWIDYEM